MIDYKKAAAIAAKYNARLKALIAKYNIEMFTEFGERYCSAHIPPLYVLFDDVSADELQAADEYIFDVHEREDRDEYEANIDKVRVILGVRQGKKEGENYDK